MSPSRGATSWAATQGLPENEEKKDENLDVAGFSVPVDQEICLVSIHSYEDNILWRVFMETTKQLVGNSVGKHLMNGEKKSS
jgi:hypothetical protein